MRLFLSRNISGAVDPSFVFPCDAVDERAMVMACCLFRGRGGGRTCCVVGRRK